MASLIANSPELAGDYPLQPDRGRADILSRPSRFNLPDGRSYEGSNMSSTSKPKPIPPRRGRSVGASQHEYVAWQRKGDDRVHRGVILGISDRRLTMVTGHRQSPRVGTCILPSLPSDYPSWNGPAIIRQVEQISDALDLITADYIEAATLGRNAAGEANSRTPQVRQQAE